MVPRIEVFAREHHFRNTKIDDTAFGDAPGSNRPHSKQARYSILSIQYFIILYKIPW